MMQERDRAVELGEHGWQGQVTPRRLQFLHEIGGASEGRRQASWRDQPVQVRPR
jgi:hypothetical protein